MIATIGYSSAEPVSSMGIIGQAYYENPYSIESSNMPSLFYNDAGRTTRFEMLSVNPSKTVYSDKYAKYSDNFDTDKWNNESHSFYGVGWRADWSNIHPTLLNQQTYLSHPVQAFQAYNPNLQLNHSHLQM